MDKVIICGIPHKIVERSDDFDADASHFGQIDYKACEILINTNMAEDIKKETLCHEILHGILAHLGYDNLSQDERFVTAVSNAICQTFDIKEQEHD